MSDQVMNEDDLDALLADAGLDESEKGAKAEKPPAGDVDMDDPATGLADGEGEPDTDLSEWGLTEDDVSASAADGKANAPAPPTKGGAPAGARNMAFDSLGGSSGNKDKPRELEFILDIPLQLTVEVGRAKIEIGELLSLGPGSIVELDKLAGEPLEVYANNKLVARGEAVIVNEKFGIRLTDVVSKHDRIENLH